MRRLWLACVSVLGLSLMLACGSDDDDGASGSGGSGGGTGGTSGIGGASGTSGTGGTGAAGGAGGSGGTAATGGTGGTAGEAGSGANAGAAGSAGDAGSGGGNTVPLTVTIYDLVQQDPIADMKVCLHEAQPENCTTTNATGVATLHVPPNQDVVVTYGTAPNFRTHALAIGADAITNGTNITTGALLERIASYLFASVNVTDDPTKGHVVGLALATEGATASIDPFSGEGPIYTSPSGTPDPTLTATSDSGAFLFVNVDPGTVEVAVELAGGTCTHELGHTGSAPNATPVPVHAGWFSIAASFECL